MATTRRWTTTALAVLCLALAACHHKDQPNEESDPLPVPVITTTDEATPSDDDGIDTDAAITGLPIRISGEVDADTDPEDWFELLVPGIGVDVDDTDRFTFACTVDHVSGPTEQIGVQVGIADVDGNLQGLLLCDSPTGGSTTTIDGGVGPYFVVIRALPDQSVTYVVDVHLHVVD